MSKISVTGELSLDGSGWDKTLGKAEKGVQHLAEEGLGELKTAMIEAFSIGAVLEATRAVLEFGEAISVGAARLGVSTDSVQQLGFAARQAGSDLGTVESALDKLARAKEEALAGGEKGDKLVEEFSRLGVTVEDLKSKSPEELFRQMGKGLEGVATNSQITADMMAIFGRNAGALIPILKELDEKSAQLKLVSPENLQALHEAKQAWDAFKDRKQATLATGMARVFSGESPADLGEYFYQHVKQISGGDMTQGAAGRGEALDKQLQALNEAAQAKKDLEALHKGTAIGPNQVSGKEQEAMDKEAAKLNESTAKIRAEMENKALTVEERITKEVQNQKELHEAIDRTKKAGVGGLPLADLQNQLALSEQALQKDRAEKLKGQKIGIDPVFDKALGGDSLTHTGNFLGTSSNSIVAIGEQTNAILRQIHAVLLGHGPGGGAAAHGVPGPT